MKLTPNQIRNRRQFLKGLVRKGMLPGVVVYTLHKNAPPLFGVSPP